MFAYHFVTGFLGYWIVTGLHNNAALFYINNLSIAKNTFFKGNICIPAQKKVLYLVYHRNLKGFV